MIENYLELMKYSVYIKNKKHSLIWQNAYFKKKEILPNEENKVKHK